MTELLSSAAKKIKNTRTQGRKELIEIDRLSTQGKIVRRKIYLKDSLEFQQKIALETQNSVNSFDKTLPYKKLDD